MAVDKMELIAYKMEYSDKIIENRNINCIKFEEKYFNDYMRIYNECFYDMRKALDRKPYNFLSNYKQIINHIDIQNYYSSYPRFT